MNNPESPQPDPALVLVVDDDKFTRIQLRRAMQRAGYQVAEASDGEQALAIYTHRNPDIVLLDALMPVIDGFTCCTQLRALPGGEHTPILMITALEDQESVDRAFAVGATDYITKPIHWAVLRQRVRHLLQASRATAALRQQTEQAQLKAAQLRLALTAAQMGTWDWDLASNTITWSEQLETLFGFKPGEYDRSYDSFINRVHPADRELVEQAVKRAITQRAEYNLEFRIIRTDGNILWVVSRGQVYYDEQGKAIRLTGINMDISDRQRIAEERDRFFTLSLDMQCIAGLDGYFKRLNPAWSKTLGYTSAELMAVPYIEFVHPEDQAATIAEAQKLTTGNPTLYFENRYRCRQGCYKWIAWTCFPIVEAGVVYAIARDITAQKQAEQERQQAEVELQRQNKRSQLFADITLKIRQSLKIDEILQTTATEVQKLLQADRALIFRLWSNGYGQVITEAVVPGFASVLNRGITDDCFSTEYLKKYQQGRIYTITDTEQSQVQPCLIEFLHQFQVKAKLVMPILLKEELWGLLIVHQCHSPRQWSNFEIELLRQLADQIGIALAQAQLLEQETRQSQELARSNIELQQFASVASHDLQEPLRKIQAFGNRLKATYGEALTEQGQDYLERMQSAAQRMQALIDDLLTLSRIATRGQPFVSVALNQVTQEVLSDLEVRIQQSGGRVEVGELPTIEADPVQIHQLLQNLISNALKFHAPDAAPVVKISSQLLDGERVPVDRLIAADFCQIIVTDNGIGFDEKYLDRIFNVFQRLHNRSEYEGTGMGLTICQRIAERHGGSITAKSQLGQGATFIVTLPIKQVRGENTE